MKEPDLFSLMQDPDEAMEILKEMVDCSDDDIQFKPKGAEIKDWWSVN